MTNDYPVTVETTDSRSSYAWVRVGGSRLAARRWPGIAPGQKLRVRIRPQDVILSRTPPGQISARNVFPGHARSVRQAPEGAYVTLDIGFPLTALITPEAALELGIRPGVELFAVMKAGAVSPSIPIPGEPRIALVGNHGMLDPEKIDFLRMVHQMGSLSSAARELGISYRTAWMWAQAINRIWGEKLIVRMHGGRGGGGTVLSAGATALLDRIRELEEQAARS